MTDTGGVRISQTQIYEGLQSVQEKIADMSALLEKHIALEEQKSQGFEARIENHGTRLGAHDVDLTNLNSRVMVIEREMKDMNKRRLSWPVIAAGVAAVVAAFGGLIGIFLTLNSIAAALNALPK